MNLDNVKAGDELWVVQQSYMRANPSRGFIEIADKVGRLWVHTSRFKFSRKTGHGEYGYEAYPSKEIYDQIQEEKTARRDIIEFINDNIDSLSVANIQKIYNLINELKGE